MANMKKVFIVIMVIGLTFTTMPVFAQSAKEAVLGLKKLHARCQAGISYRDYSNAVADAKFPVNLFMESEDAKKFPDLADSVKAVMKHYEYAGYIWDNQMSVISRLDAFSSRGLIATDSALGKEFNNLYPGTPETKGYYYVPLALSNIWGKAAQELENTTKLYAKTESDESNDIDKLKKENENLKKQLELMKPKGKQ